MGFGSDCAVTPCDPLLTISSAVNHSLPDERISPTNALYFHTIGSAYIGMEEKDKGSITPGKFADMVFLDADPTEVDSSEIKDIPVKMTIAKGHVIFVLSGSDIGNMKKMRMVCQFIFPYLNLLNSLKISRTPWTVFRPNARSYRLSYLKNNSFFRKRF